MAAGSLTLTLLLYLASVEAAAQDVWETAPDVAPYHLTDAPSPLVMAPRTGRPLVRLPTVTDAADGQSGQFDTQVRPADYVPENAPENTEFADVVPDDAQFYTLDELRAEMKKLAWVKGDFKIVPYGMLWGSAFYATERTFPATGYVFWVNSASDEGEPAFTLDTRRTRLGIDVSGPQVWMPVMGCMESGGKVEIDFFGAFATGENRAGLLLRHGYAQLKNDDWRLLAGQTFDVISPLWPGTIAYPVGWTGGNIGFRRMQVLLERYLHFSDTCMVTASGSINQNILTDVFADARSESSFWPIIMGRVGLTLGQQGPGCKPVTMGVSGHIGQQEYDFLKPEGGFPVPRYNVEITTWSLNGDLKVPLGERLGIQGECFTGSDLGTFFGGVFQGINLIHESGIRSNGGWLDMWYDWTPRLHSHVGYGVDDPINSDVMAGGRVYNSFLFGNVTFDVTKKMILGFEVANWKTHFSPLGRINEPGDAVVFEFTGSYGF